MNSRVLAKIGYFLRSAHEDAEMPDLIKDFENFEKEAVSRVDRFRAAIVAADLIGASAGVERLERLDKEVEPSGELASEVFWLLKRYKQVALYDEYTTTKKSFDAQVKEAAKTKKPTPSKPAILKTAAPIVETMSEEMRLSIVARHGFFGQLALVQGPDRDESARNELLGRYLDTVDFSEGMETVRWWMGAVGLIALAIFIQRQTQGDPIGLDDPVAPTTVYLEMVAIMVLSFAITDGIEVLFLGNHTPLTVALSEAMMWGLPVCIFWPRLRGVAWSDIRKDLGLHAGEGVLKEVSIGIAAACAEMFFYNVLDWVLGIIESVKEPEHVPVTVPPGMYDTPDGSTWFLLSLGVLGTVVWAPLFEEVIFRGALQRWLRVRMRPIFAVLITAAVFGFIHPYSVGGLLSVAFGGLFLCTLREWRQCLIAPMVMHFVGNGMITLDEIGFLHNLGC